MLTSSHLSEIGGAMSSSEDSCSRQNSTSTEGSCGDLSTSYEDNKNLSKKNPFFNQNTQSESSSSSKGSRNKDEKLEALVTKCSKSVSRCFDLLKVLQSLEEENCQNQDNKSPEDIVQQLRSNLDEVEEDILSSLPRRLRLQISHDVHVRSVNPLDDVTLLFGRCFNLSLNLKILRSSQQGVDPNIAARILSDLRVLDVSLTSRMSRDSSASSNSLAEYMTNLNMENTASKKPNFIRLPPKMGSGF